MKKMLKGCFLTLLAGFTLLPGAQAESSDLKAATPQLDTSSVVKLKPFTLNAAANASNTDTSGAALTPKLDTVSPLSGSVGGARFSLKASEAAHLLSNYDVQILVDRSNSMKATDCPEGLSRWQWCGLQSASLAQSIFPFAPQGLTIVPFACEYDVFDHANAQHIAYIFNYLPLQKGTRLYEPLAEQMDTYFANRSRNKKPLLVVVVTDGMPAPSNEPELVRRELVATSNRMTGPQEVTVIFCQIGGADRQGQAYLQDLDQNLTSYGARYNIVHTITFDQMLQQGLGTALAATIEKYAPVTPPALKKSPPQNSSKLLTHATRITRGRP